jgi:hypothetical protein
MARTRGILPTLPQVCCEWEVRVVMSLSIQRHMDYCDRGRLSIMQVNIGDKEDGQQYLSSVHRGNSEYYKDELYSFHILAT